MAVSFCKLNGPAFRQIFNQVQTRPLSFLHTPDKSLLTTNVISDPSERGPGLYLGLNAISKSGH